MRFETVPSTSDVEVTVTTPLTHRCPFVDEIDNGTITITWRVDGETFELHSLRHYLNSFADVEISHEGITDLIRHDLSTVPDVELISVSTAWETAGMEVRCSTSVIPFPERSQP